jgi:hypothetical protein
MDKNASPPKQAGRLDDGLGSRRDGWFTVALDRRDELRRRTGARMFVRLAN